MTEYPFKDLLPLDEVLEREGYYKDWTHLDPEVFYSLTQISEYIKTKGYGVDVRLLISQLAEHFGLRVTQITDAMNEFNDLKPKAELSVSQSAEALTKSQSALNVANSADTLSKSVQEQFNQVVIDGDSSVEAAQARVDASGQTNATLKDRLDKEHNEVTTQLAQKEEEINLVNSKIKRNNEDTYGTHENASVESIIANDAASRPEVLGISLENDHILATYTNRDSVASYRSNRTRKPTYNIDNVAYTVDSVTVPEGIDLSKIKTGMIIDTKHNPKFSGFIVGVEGQKILVNNWYEMGNTAKGQIPTGTTGIHVNPMTTPWVDNVNLFLDSDSDTLDGVGVELGVVNQKAPNIGKGINIVSLGVHRPEVAYKATSGTTNSFVQGFNAGVSDTAFINSNENTNSYLLYNEKTGYRIKNSGVQNKLRLELALASTNRTADPRRAPIFLIDTLGTVKIVSPSGLAGMMLYVLNTTSQEILMEWSYWNPSQAGSITIPAKSMKTMVSDGGRWYHF